MAAPNPSADTVTGTPRGRSPLFSALVGLTSLLILLQGLWAGIFLQEDGKRDDYETWLSVHEGSGYLAVLLALAATVVALVQLRHRRDLWVGSLVLTVLLIVEVGLGSLIEDAGALTVVHIPLAMALMAIVVWLPLRSGRVR